MSNKIIKFLITFAVLIFLISIVITVYSLTNKPNTQNITNEKVSKEVEYLDSELITIINSLNNLNSEYLISNKNATEDKTNSQSESSGGDSKSSGGSSSQSSSNEESSSKSGSQTSNTIVSTIDTEAILSRDKNDIDWKYIQSQTELLNKTWATISIDLKSINISNDDILAFNNNMDTALKYIKNKDKANSLISIANIYSLIPKYKSGYDKDYKDVEIAFAKSDIVSSYALLETKKWDDILKLLGDADSKLTGQINSSENNENLQKIYVLLKDYIKSANDKDTDLCYMKYYYLINEYKNIS